MPGMKPGDSMEEILRELKEQAVRQFGEARAAEINATLEQTARQIWDVDQEVLEPDLEPGFYQ